MLLFHGWTFSRKSVRGLLFWGWICFWSPFSFAASDYEHILAFDVQASFSNDGSMAVTESITVYATGDEINHGIFRTLPLTWNRQDGKIFRVGYQVEQVLRDGSPEPYSEARTGDMLELRIGDAFRTVDTGEHTYVIYYRVSNHFSRFPDWDELYWNVTGNGWPYDIDSASFQLTLPDSAAHLNSDGYDQRLRSIDVYTGYQGERDAQAEILADGSVSTVASLSAQQGLTVVYTWPRGILANAPDPDAVNPWIYALLPNEKSLVLWIPVLAMLVWFPVWCWRKVVRAGLKKPPVIPLYDIPEGITPGFIRYVSQRRFDNVVFSSDLLDLVARRTLSLTLKTPKASKQGFWSSSPKEEQWLSRQTEGRTVDITPDDQQLLKTLFPDAKRSINLNQAHQPVMQKALRLVEQRYSAQKSALFLGWRKAFWVGILLLLTVPLLCAVFINGGVGVLTLLALAFLLFTAMFAFIAFTVLRASSRGVMRWGCAPLILLAVSIPNVIAVMSWTTSMPLGQLPAGYIGALLAGMAILLVFGITVPKYTQQGLVALAMAEGLKRYLSTAETHRYETLYPPEQRVTHFERMLPYALALGVGETWANAFSDYLVDSGSMSEIFSNTDWHHVRSFSDSCRSSAMAKPSASRGGSGSRSSGSGSSGRGSSGGGSGGGGGGGW
ncbi:DUF2207 domain-containing protein [Trabulsiella odontotermitis]|uniref:DUF2207 domain-containing protein n=1 Tax=Trabulsiella odontotermitis TaxID=379893 RepID=UPI0009C0FCED|nr:DUF2207 domain-containing protein [Trabulsiella odontotermitis]